MIYLLWKKREIFWGFLFRKRAVLQARDFISEELYYKLEILFLKSCIAS